MEDQTKIISTKLGCCEDCPKKLEEELLKMPGVDSVAIDREKNLVLVTGPIDAITLINGVAKLGKRVKLLPTYEHPKYKDKHKHSTNSCHKHHKKEQSTSHQLKGRMHTNCCCCQNGSQKHKKKEEEEHKCEAYVPPKYDERICRDYYCKIHPQGRKIVDNMPKESGNWFGGFPFYPNLGGVNPYGDSYLQSDRWYGEEPRLGFHRRQRMLPHPFQF